MKRNLFLLFFFFLAGITLSFSENETTTENSNAGFSNASLLQESSFLNKINVGGNIGGGFSNNYFFLNIQPRISYRLTQWFIPGISILYQYSQDRGSNSRWTTNIWGAGVFANIYPIKNLYAHIEYQHLWYSQDNRYDTFYSNNSFLLLGAGATIPIGNNLYMNASILFNVLEDKNNIYQNPIYSVGFGIRL